MAADGDAPDDAAGLERWLVAHHRRDEARQFASFFVVDGGPPDELRWDEAPFVERYGEDNVCFVAAGSPLVIALMDHHGLDVTDGPGPSPGAYRPSAESCRACHKHPWPSVAADICRRDDGTCSGSCAIWEPDVLPVAVTDAIRAAYAVDAVVHTEWTNEPPWRASWIVEVHSVPEALAPVLQRAGFERQEEHEFPLRRIGDDSGVLRVPERWALTGWMPERFSFETYGATV